MRNIAKFKSAVLLILQNLWLDTLVFLSTRLVVVPNQIQYTAYVYENRVQANVCRRGPKLPIIRPSLALTTRCYA